MIIDAHNHPNWHGHNLEKMICNMDRYQIDQTWILSTERPQDEYPKRSAYSHLGENGPIPFSDCVNYAERKPDRFVLGYAPDPRRPYAIERLEAAISIHGVRVCGEIKLRMMYDNPDALALFRFCGEKKLPVIVHIDYEIGDKGTYPRPNWWYGGGIEPFERAVAACPHTIFIGHAPGFWAHISKDDKYKQSSYPKGPIVRNGKVPMMLTRYPNLYCDLSAGSGLNALQRDKDYARSFLTTFSERILYGRDCFDNKHQEFLNSLDLDQKILDLIYYKNAKRLIE